MSDPRDDVYQVAALLAELDRVLNPLLPEERGEIVATPVIPPPLPPVAPRGAPPRSPGGVPSPRRMMGAAPEGMPRVPRVKGAAEDRTGGAPVARAVAREAPLPPVARAAARSAGEATTARTRAVERAELAEAVPVTAPRSDAAAAPAAAKPAITRTTAPAAGAKVARDRDAGDPLRPRRARPAAPAETRAPDEKRAGVAPAAAPRMRASRRPAESTATRAGEPRDRAAVPPRRGHAPPRITRAPAPDAAPTSPRARSGAPAAPTAATRAPAPDRSDAPRPVAPRALPPPAHHGTRTPPRRAAQPSRETGPGPRRLGTPGGIGGATGFGGPPQPPPLPRRPRTQAPAARSPAPLDPFTRALEPEPESEPELLDDVDDLDLPAAAPAATPAFWLRGGRVRVPSGAAAVIAVTDRRFARFARKRGRRL